MRAVAHLLGHRKLTITDRYLRAQEGDARAALEAADSRGVSGANDSQETGMTMIDEVTIREDSVRRRGLEPLRFYPLVPETSASANSATFAR